MRKLQLLVVRVLFGLISLVVPGALMLFIASGIVAAGITGNRVAVVASVAAILGFVGAGLRYYWLDRRRQAGEGGRQRARLGAWQLAIIWAALVCVLAVFAVSRLIPLGQSWLALVFLSGVGGFGIGFAVFMSPGVAEAASGQG